MTPDDPAPATAENAAGSSPYVLLCEHAANVIPARYERLGLDPAELERHIAWDPGAAALARGLSRDLDAPLFLSGYSRLLIDCNRPLGTPTSIPEQSEATVIPGNAGLPAEERGRRAAAYFTPFERLVTAELDRRTRQAIPTIVLGIHSFTPVFLGIPRPWHAGVLYAGAAAFGRALLDELATRGPGLILGDNAPYMIEPEHDYTVPVHGDARGVPAALIEVRNDLLGAAGDVEAWTGRLAASLSAISTLARIPRGV